MKVREMMTPDAVCVRPDASLQEAAAKMRELDVGPLPVCGDDEQLVGMLTDRDITIRSVAKGQDPKITRVGDVMTPEVIYVFEDQDVAEAAEIMKANQVRRLVVLNRNKRLVGIVSLGDLAVDSGDEMLAGDTLEAISEPVHPRH